ncbi:MAG: DUF4132 domain-containing protein [Lachnospiraceae bacterium]|nr:DUF4132 domain-containing protein [Lachnospiraceae bacterium]
MYNPNNQRVVKVMELLEATKVFTSDELTAAESYLLGETDGREIRQFPFRDLSQLPSGLDSKFNMLFTELTGKGRGEEGEKLAQILFTAGESTGANLFPMMFFNFGEKFAFILEPEKRAALYAVRIGQSENMIGRFSIENLMKIAEKDPMNIQKAAAYQRNKNENGRLILLMTYFLLKYPEAKPMKAAGRQGGLLAGMGRLLGQKTERTEAGIEFDAQDGALMKRYEDILVNSIGNLYTNNPAQSVIKELQNAINNDKVDERVLKTAKAGAAVDRFMLRILGGTAFVNFALSDRLKNVLTICLAASAELMLNIMESMDLREDLKNNAGELDEILQIESRRYIKWATGKSRTDILGQQFTRNQKIFLEFMEKADFGTYNTMMSVIRELDPGLYKQKWEAEISYQQTQVIDAFTKIVEPAVQPEVRAYLSGEAGIETLYAHEDKMYLTGNWRWSGNHWSTLQSYQKGHGHDALSNRCETLVMMCRGLNNYNYLYRSGGVSEKEIRRLFSAVDTEKLALRHQLSGYVDIESSYYLGNWKNVFESTVKDIFRVYLSERREEMLAAFQAADSVGRCFGLTIMAEETEQNKEAILSFAQDSSKAVKEQLLDILYKASGWEEDIVALLSSKKAADRDVAVRVLTKWGGEKYSSILTEALEKEKNGKVRALLENALNIGGGSESGDKAVSQTDLVKEIHKGNKKRALAWAYETPFSKVHKKSGEEADEEYLQAILLCYSTMSPCGISQGAVLLAGALNENEFAVYVNELFDKWLEAGAESKKRWVLYAAAIHGGMDIIQKMHHQIQEWPQNARGAIASEAVQALALSPQPQALLIVDGISRKFKFKQVKAAAEKALEFAASQLGITKEELADRIVPDLGFDENMQRCFDYGERKFTVTITPALEIEVFDEGGKKLKSLPAPGKRDNEEKAAAAYEEFKQMKKQMKTTVSSQKMRLEMALSTERQWTVEAWKNLFVKNPIMHQFAIGLIWGIYEDRKLVSTFRYMEDGSFNTEEEDEFELPESSQEETNGQNEPGGRKQYVGIVHPIELSKESLEAWKQQMEDYEITQPIDQLERPVYYRTEEEQEQRSLERFGGRILNDLSLGGKLLGAGWYRGSVQDAGGFYTYYREDPELAMGVELHFSGSFVGGGNEDVTVYEARFYKAGTIRRGSYEYDEADDKNSYQLKEVPERYFSEIVLQLSKAVAASKDKNENWKRER